ncbi:neuropeptide Y receptor type 1 [Biomphalaria pfeifferi]|uniref:Neuropeptide Y receptor type 1 n=1 Tax=Biomphalaria pfeifferi TaxID=112525 RepID=A0AAD8BHV6_BIOPF|nr:neuropeptide Y receptor type 1 [Biomphalaria pfeifferi]
MVITTKITVTDSMTATIGFRINLTFKENVTHRNLSTVMDAVIKLATRLKKPQAVVAYAHGHIEVDDRFQNHWAEHEAEDQHQHHHTSISGGEDKEGDVGGAVSKAEFQENDHFNDIHH